MKKMLIVSMSICLTASVFASENKNKEENKSKTEKITTKNEESQQVKPIKRVIFSIEKAYKAEKLVCKQMDMMNGVFTEIPMSTVRLFKAAVETKKLLEEVDKMKPVAIDESTGYPIYFDNKDDEAKFIRSKIKAILDPIDKFLEEALEKSGPIAKALIEKILGEDAKNGFLLPALVSGNKPSIYLEENMTTVRDLVGGISEFWIFFSVINASLTDSAKRAYTAKLKELQQDQLKNKANNAAKAATANSSK